MNVAIIGGGISGLSLAHFLKTLSNKGAIKVSLFESCNKLGGWSNITNVDDFGVHGSPIIFGPKSIRCGNVKTHSVLYMLSSLNIEDRLLVFNATHKSTYERYIFSNSQMNLANLKNIIYGNISPFNSLFEAIKIAGNCIRSCRGVDRDISVHEFFSKNISERFTNEIINPVFHGIYAANCKELSLQFCLNDLYEIALRGGSLFDYMISKPEYPSIGSSTLQNQIMNSKLNQRQKAEKWKMFIGKGGVYEFVTEIEKNLIQSYPDTFTIYKNNKVTAINFQQYETKSVGVVETLSEKHEFDYIFSTIPAYELSNILPGNLNKLKALLADFEYSSVVVIILEYNAKQCVNFNCTGFGVVVPSQEVCLGPVMGIVFDSNLFNTSLDSNSNKMFTLMMGSDHFVKYFGSYENASSSKILQHSIKIMQKYFNITSNPVRSCVRILNKSILKPKLAHLTKALECHSLASKLPICLSGTIFSGISLPDCVHHSLITSSNFLDTNSMNKY